MIQSQRCFRLSGMLLLVALVGLAPGCTALDDILPGTPFTPDQPVAEVSVVGAIYIDTVTVSSEGCSAGTVLLWGTALNTGDLDVQDVFIEIDALGANNGVLDTYRVNVFNGEIIEGSSGTQFAGTSLAVDQSGSFQVCTRQPAGSVAGTAYRTDFIIISEIK